MEAFLKIIYLAFLTGIVSMLIIKLIKYLTRDKDEM